MSLAIFDLDNTLLRGDSDYEWGQYLIGHHIVDGEDYERENQRFYDEYKAGTLDIFEFLAFALRPLAQNDRQRLEALREDYMRERIEPMITDDARNLVEHHRRRNDTLLIITATNSFVTTPIARAFGIDHLLATEPEVVNGQFTGRVSGTPCFKEGKVERLNSWLQQNHHSLVGSWFYSDSHNDLPLLRCVDNPVAVNPDEALKQIAQREGWAIKHLY